MSAPRRIVQEARWLLRYGPRFTAGIRLATGPWAALRAALVTARLLVARQTGPRRPLQLPLDVRLEGTPHRVWVGDSSDLEVLRELFVEREYDVELPAPPSVIVDLGAHIGLSALWWASRYPSARIVALEPNPEVLERLRRNTSAVEAITVTPCAVTGDGTRELRFAPHSEGWRAAASSNGRVVVPAISVEELLEAEAIDRVDILKMDVEGAEFGVLAGAQPWLEHVGALVVELHDAPSSSAVHEALESLRSFDVTVTEIRDDQVVLNAVRP